MTAFTLQIFRGLWRRRLGMEMADRPELPACAAIRLKNGLIIADRRHNNCLMQVHLAGIDKRDVLDQGFMTTHGNFVSRATAWRMNYGAGLKSASPDGYRGKDLYSEDLY